MSLPPRSSTPLERLFAGQHQVETATSALSVALLALFGISFAADIQAVYEKVWRLAAPSWRQDVWPAVLSYYLAAEVESGV